MVNNHGDRKSPKDRVTPLPNGRFMAYKWWLLTTYSTNWGDPPSTGGCNDLLNFHPLEKMNHLDSSSNCFNWMVLKKAHQPISSI